MTCNTSLLIGLSGGTCHSSRRLGNGHVSRALLVEGRSSGGGAVVAVGRSDKVFWPKVLDADSQI